MKYKSHAKIIDYADYKEDQALECPVCGWNGKAGEASKEHYNDLFDLSCPSCEQMLLVVSYPLVKEDVEQERKPDLNKTKKKILIDPRIYNPEQITELLKIFIADSEDPRIQNLEGVQFTYVDPEQEKKQS